MAIDDANVSELITVIKNLTQAIGKKSSKGGDSDFAFVTEDKSLKDRLKSNEDIKTVIEDQNKILESQKELSDLFLKNRKDLVDYEEILEGIENNRKDILASQYRTILEVLAEKIKEREELEKIGKLTEEERKKRNKEIDELREAARLRANELADQKKLEEGKTAILSVSKDILGFLMKQEQVMVNLYKLTGGANREIAEASKIIAVNTLASGVTIEQGQQALTNLASGFNNLRAYGASAAATMGTTAAYMEKIGISGATSAKSFDTLVNAMGRTPQQASAIEQSFVQMAAKNKMALNTVTEAFAQNSSRFVGYGAEMTKVLDGLAEQAMKTGLKIDELVNIAQGFDTFEDAAKKAGTLNALLGDQFNAIELLTASDEERIKLLQDGVRASGLQWDSMDRFQKMALANAAGIKDLNQAGKILGNTLSQNTALEQDSAAAKKTLQEHALETSVSMDKLQSTLNGLMVVITPLVINLMNLASGIMQVVKGFHWLFSLGGNFPTFGAAVTSLFALMIWKGSLVTKAFTALGGKISWFGKLMSTTTAGAPNPAAAKSFGETTRSIGSAISNFFKSLSENFGRVMLGILVAGLVAAVIVALVVGLNKMADLDGPKILGGIVLLGLLFAAIYGLGTLMGSGVGAVVFAAGISAFLGLAAALAVMGGALIIMSTGLQGIADAFTKLKTATDNFGTTATSIEQFVSSLLDMNLDGVDKLSESISKLAESIKELNLATTAMGALKDFEAKMTSLVNFSVSGQASETSVGTSLTNVNSLTPSNINILSPQFAMASAAQQNNTNQPYVPVVMYVDGQKLGEILDPKIKKTSSDIAANAVHKVGVVSTARQASALEPLERSN